MKFSGNQEKWQEVRKKNSKKHQEKQKTQKMKKNIASTQNP